LFVKKVFHNTQARLERYKEQTPSTRRKPRVTQQHVQSLVKAMEEYASRITPERLSAAKQRLKELRRGESTSRTFTASETYSGILQRHRARPNHEERMAQLQQEGFLHNVLHDPGSRAAVQERSATRSFIRQPSTTAQQQPTQLQTSPPPEAEESRSNWSLGEVSLYLSQICKIYKIARGSAQEKITETCTARGTVLVVDCNTPNPSAQSSKHGSSAVLATCGHGTLTWLFLECMVVVLWKCPVQWVLLRFCSSIPCFLRFEILQTLSGQFFCDCDQRSSQIACVAAMRFRTSKIGPSSPREKKCPDKSSGRAFWTCCENFENLL